MFNLMSSIRDLIVTIFIIILVLPSSTGVDSGYITCTSSLFSCGNVSNVGYPFWGDGRPRYCGHPALQLQCFQSENGEWPTLTIGSKDEAPYNVLSMKHFDSNITLELQGFENIHCTSYNKNISNIFKFSPSVENITFLYNCPSNILPRNSTNLVTCYEDQNHAKYQAYYVSNMSAHKEYSSCSSTVVPVFRKPLVLHNKGVVRSITQVLSQGFEASYEYSPECLRCKNSGGICGSSNVLDFVCLCKNRPSNYVCQMPGILYVLLSLWDFFTWKFYTLTNLLLHGAYYHSYTSYILNSDFVSLTHQHQTSQGDSSFLLDQPV
ncbi:hypothetical protein RND81_11G132200 [Saponaria officinalis]|uniref:non-specific serine/threonine protein kinase n=1 Tax=Saponaria officinalis TaxID=3572 RepID=A0AAW1HLM0_SAPOF